jgi:hypothetical protein
MHLFKVFATLILGASVVAPSVGAPVIHEPDMYASCLPHVIVSAHVLDSRKLGAQFGEIQRARSFLPASSSNKPSGTTTKDGSTLAKVIELKSTS